MKNRKLVKAVSTSVVLAMLAGTTVSAAQAPTLKDVFDARYYSQTYDDLAQAFGTDAEKLYNHYIHYGQAEERSFTPLIDLKKYREAYPDLNAAFGDDWNAYLNHYLVYGINEGRSSYGVFDAIAYADRYSDLRDAFGYDVLALYQHYMTFGVNEGREGGTTAADNASDSSASGSSTSNSNTSGNNSSANTPSESGNGSGYAPSESGNGTGAGSTDSGSQVTPDSGSTDSGSQVTPDSGSADSGSQVAPDSGSTDSGSQVTPDSGSTDSGSQVTPDSGNTDSGSQVTPDSGSTGETGGTDTGSDSGFVTDPAAIEAFGVNTTYHTAAEVRSYMQSSGAGIYKDTSANGVNLSAPYAAGEVSAESLQYALAMLNQVRYIAGLDAVALNSDYTQKAQAASMLNAVNGTISHYPTQPTDMADELYQLGYNAASKSNLAWTSWGTTLSYSVLSWMDDSDASNIARVGHRRWILNPSMQETGFGYVYFGEDTYSSMYAMDNAFGETDKSGVAWPAREMPVAYFENDMAWSWSYGQTLGEVTVTLQCLNTQKAQTWNFSSGSADFYVDNDNYGRPGCVIFRPVGISIAAGDVYRVTITNNGATLADYTVSFFE